MSDTQQDTLLVLSARLGTLHEDVTEIKVALKALSDAITKLALVEERQVQTAAALERAFSALGKLENRMTALEMRCSEFSAAKIWVDRAVWATVAAAMTYVAKKAGLL